MIEDDEKRLLDRLKEEWNEGHRTWEQNMLRLAKAAREFHETGEFRSGDEVQYNFSAFGKYVGLSSEGRFVVQEPGGMLVFTDFIRPKPKTERVMLGQIEMMRWLVDNGWIPDPNGVYRHADHSFYFYPRFWQYCGWKIGDIPNCYPVLMNSGWFKEVDA